MDKTLGQVLFEKFTEGLNIAPRHGKSGACYRWEDQDRRDREACEAAAKAVIAAHELKKAFK